MPTLEQTITNLLVEHGLWEAEAQEIMTQIKFNDEVMGSRWNEQDTDYSPALVQALWMNARLEAVEWIDKNKPRHWARGMFADDVPAAGTEPNGP